MAAEVTKRDIGPCPDLEVLAAYLDGRLAHHERAAVAAHVAACDTCYFVFSEASQIKAPTSSAATRPSWWTTSRIMWSSAAGLAAAAVIVLAVTITGVWPRRSGAPELSGLVAAVGTDRTIEPRLTGGFAYGAVRGAMRSGASALPNISPDVRIAVAQIEKETIARRTPQSLNALGIAYLVTGDVNRAIPVLEEAADQPTANPRILSDLGAAYLVRASQSSQSQDLAKALTMADRAVKADATLAPAWFNRALALERLSLVEDARRAWEEYLKIDDSSGWAGEARSHLQALNSPPSAGGPGGDKVYIASVVQQGDARAIQSAVEKSPDAARQLLQDRLLGDWSQAVLATKPAAASKIVETSRPVAKALLQSTGDRFYSDAFDAAATVSANSDQATLLARAYASFRAGQLEYGQDRIQDSQQHFRAAVVAFDRMDRTFGLWGHLFLAIGRYAAGDLAGALNLLEPIAQRAEQRDYLRVLGLSYRLRGVILGVRGDFASALEAYRRGLEFFTRVRDHENRAATHALISEMLDFLGEPDLAWGERSTSLAQLPLVSDRRQRHQILLQASLASLRQGLPESSRYFQRAALDNAVRWERPLAIFDAHLYQSEVERQLGNTERALDELRDAATLVAKINDAALVRRNQAQLRLAEGELQWASQPARARAALSEALEFFRETHRNWPLARVYLARARAHRVEGRDDLAEADLNAGIEFFENQRAAVTDEALRSASFEQPWDLYSEIIQLHAVSRHAPDRALSFAERARARTLLETLSPDGGMRPVDPASARASLPTSLSVLYYVALNDRLLTWVLRREQVTFLETPVRHVDLAHLLQQYAGEMASGTIAPRDTPSLARLYDLLIRPVRHAVPAADNIVIVPDRVLHGVPFAALLRREDRRYLVEDHTIQVTPSLTMFLAASSKGAVAPQATSALVVGNPLLTDETATSLPDLPEAEAEARDVARFYPDAVVLTGQAASKEAFLREAGAHSVVHFAGHAIANDAHPQLSRLLFAGPNEASRTVFARDIAQHRFASTRLVVLAACRTSVGRIRRGEGVFSLARPFLASGVPTVVASLWDVNDRASRRLLVAFHEALRSGGTAAAALRRAQLLLMGDANVSFQSPSGWAGFTVIGA